MASMDLNSFKGKTRKSFSDEQILIILKSISWCYEDEITINSNEIRKIAYSDVASCAELSKKLFPEMKETLLDLVNIENVETLDSLLEHELTIYNSILIDKTLFLLKFEVESCVNHKACIPAVVLSKTPINIVNVYRIFGLPMIIKLSEIYDWHELLLM